MAKLEGVIYPDCGGFIVYGRETYKQVSDVPKPGDIVYDGKEYFAVVRDTTGQTWEDSYDGISVMREFGEAYVRKTFVAFRKNGHAADILASKHTQLATLTAEIAQLEAQLAEESRLKVGDYARVTDITSVDNFDEGDIVFIARFDDSRVTYVLRGERPMSEDYEWFSPAALTKITPAEARTSLIAKIDAHFGGQEAK